MNYHRSDNRFGENYDVYIVPGFESPPSPPSSYDNSYPPDNKKIEPPLLHFQLPEKLPENPNVGNHSKPDCLPQPPQPILNHLYIEQRISMPPVLGLMTNYRFREKFVTLVYFKAVRNSRARWP